MEAKIKLSVVLKESSLVKQKSETAMQFALLNRYTKFLHDRIWEKMAEYFTCIISSNSDNFNFVHKQYFSLFYK